MNERLKRAIKITLGNGECQTQLLQREIPCDYFTAVRLVDEMEALGVVGPHVWNGQPRKLLIESIDELKQTKMTNEFCKIIALPNHQVLVEYADDPEGRPGIRVTSFHEGISMSVHPAWDDDDNPEIDKMYDSYDVDKATKFVDNFLSLLDKQA